MIEEEPGRLVEVRRAGPETHRDDRAGVGGAEGHQGGDGLPARRRGVDVAGGADLQEVRRRVDLRGAERAVPAGRRGVGDRVQDRRRDRPGGRDPARQPAAGAGRHPVHAVRGRRQRALLPARAEPAHRRRADPAGPRRPGPHLPGRPGRDRRRDPGTGARTRAPRAGRSRRCIWCRSTAPKPPWPRRCCGCRTRSADRLPAFASVDWGKALAWLRARTGAELAAGAGAGGAAGVDREGGGADRRARLRQVVHRQVGDHVGGGEAGEDRAGGADRAGRETADRAVRAPGRHRAPAAATAPRRGPRASTGTTRSTPT